MTNATNAYNTANAHEAFCKPSAPTEPNMAIKLLVTGFGAFPGVRKNPSLMLLTQLERRRARLARLGISLDLQALPVVYSGIGRHLADIVAKSRPDGIIHFGLAGRRRCLSVELQARNRANPLRPDAAGVPPATSLLQAGAPPVLKSRLPAPHIVAAWRRAGIAGGVSHDAGDYVCNACLYLSLSRSGAARVGFIHLPGRRVQNGRAAMQETLRAAEIALIASASAIRQDRMTAMRQGAVQPSCSRGG